MQFFAGLGNRGPSPRVNNDGDIKQADTNKDVTTSNNTTVATTTSTTSEGGGSGGGKTVSFRQNLSTTQPTEEEPTPDVGSSVADLTTKVDRLESELMEARQLLQMEKSGKRKLYASVVKIAQELKATREKADEYQKEAEFANKRWYEGGMWRTPQLRPGLGQEPEEGRGGPANINEQRPAFARDAISLTDLFFFLVIVTAFSRVGVAVQDRGTVDAPMVAFFAVFWSIWLKETSYSTRFDTTDLSSIAEAMLTCFAVLFGAISCTETFQSLDATRIMMVAAFVALLHFLLHLRIERLYKNDESTVAYFVRKYARHAMIMTFLEAFVWIIGIVYVPVGHPHRWAIFLAGVILGVRVPGAYLTSDFHAEKTKRGVLFILLLGFTLQSLVVVASPFFIYQTPNVEQYLFLGSACLLLFCIKLLFVDDNIGVEAHDHALVVSRAAGFFFNIGQFCLLLAMTVLSSGMDLLTHSYLAAQEALPDNAKNLVCGGFSAVVLSIAFIKSMHVRRVPNELMHKRMFFMAYGIQVLVTFTIAYVTFRMCVDEGYFSILQSNEIVMLFVLSGSALFLVIISWLDEAVEMSLYNGQEAHRFRVHAFGFWPCLRSEDLDINDPEHRRLPRISTERLSLLAKDMRMTQRIEKYDSLLAQSDDV